MDLVKPAEVFHHVGRRLREGQRTIVANHNTHSLVIARKSPEFRKFYSAADLVQVDSVPLLFWARLIGGRGRRFHRSTYLDWREGFWERAQAEGWRVFFVGGRPGVGERARARLLERWPKLELAVHHGHFDAAPGSSDNDAVHAAIAAFGPDILLVGMGMPRQELWVMQNLQRLGPCAIFTVGGAFDYEAGTQTACPRWIGRLGAEWLFRLALDPGRLGRRYLIEPLSLADLVARDLIRLAIRRLAGPKRRSRERPASPAAGTPPPAVGLGAEPPCGQTGLVK